MKRGWLALTIILLVFAVWTMANSVYWILIGYSVEHGSGFVIGTLLFPIILFAGVYETWKRARA